MNSLNKTGRSQSQSQIIFPKDISDKLANSQFIDFETFLTSRNNLSTLSLKQKPKKLQAIQFPKQHFLNKNQEQSHKSHSNSQQKIEQNIDNSENYSKLLDDPKNQNQKNQSLEQIQQQQQQQQQNLQGSNTFSNNKQKSSAEKNIFSITQNAFYNSNNNQAVSNRTSPKAISQQNFSLNNNNNDDQLNVLQNSLHMILDKEEETYAALQNRCHKVLDLLNLFESHQFNFQFEQDFEKFKLTLNDLMFTLVQASRNEIKFGQKFRQGEKQSMEISQLNLEIKRMKEKNTEQKQIIELQQQRIKSLQQENNSLKIELNKEKKEGSESKKKVTNLQQRIQFILENEVNKSINPNDSLRSCLNQLIKENESYKRDIDYKNSEIEREKGKIKHMQQMIVRQQKQIENSQKNATMGGSHSSNSQPQKDSDGNIQIFKNLQADLLRNYEIPYSLEYRVQSLSLDNQNVLKDILELGIHQFTNHLFTEIKSEKERNDKIVILCKQYNDEKEFSTKLNGVLRELNTCILSDNFAEIQTHISKVMGHHFSCERVLYWLVDSFTGLLYTNKIDPKTQQKTTQRIMMNKGLISEVFQFKQAINTKNPNKKAIYYDVTNQKNISADNLLFCPILSKNKKIRGILEFSNCSHDIFTQDEEYYAIVMTQFLSYQLEQSTNIQVFELERKYKNQLFDALLNLVESKSEYEFTQLVQKQVIEVFGIQNSKMCFVKNNRLIIFNQFGNPESFTFDNGIIGTVASQQSSYIVLDVKSSSAYNNLVDIYSILPIYTFPILLDQALQDGPFNGVISKKCIGVLQVALKQQLKEQEEKDKLIDINTDLLGMNDQATNVFNCFSKVIASAYIMLNKQYQWNF